MSNQPQNPALGRIRTELLVGLIFAILALIGFLIINTVAILPYVYAVAPGAPRTLITAGMLLMGMLIKLFTNEHYIIFIIFLSIYTIVTVRIYEMYKAANAGDVATLKSMNPIAWGIIALIFSGLIPGIIPGIMLLIVATLKSMNPIAWGIIALIFSGLIPGIMLLIAHGTIQQLQ
ncbi:MAG: hypothetical protein RXO22_02285 [Thermocladium sp.]